MRLLIAALLCAVLPALADPEPKIAPAGNMMPIALPSDGDDYSRLVALAAARDPTTDFRALRFAWLDSAARKRHSERSLADLRRDLNETTQGGDPVRVRDKAIELLSLEYIDLAAQKLLRQSCQVMRDAICAEQARFVEFGLLRSITASGDGKTCATGREVAFVGEEYFLLSMLGIKTRQQALQGGKNGSHSCDIMTGEDSKGETVVSYFIIDRVLTDEAKTLEPKKP